MHSAPAFALRRIPFVPASRPDAHNVQVSDLNLLIPLNDPQPEVGGVWQRRRMLAVAEERWRGDHAPGQARQAASGRLECVLDPWPPPCLVDLVCVRCPVS